MTIHNKRAIITIKSSTPADIPIIVQVDEDSSEMLLLIDVPVQ